MTTTYPGSLSLVRKHPGHVHGDMDDGTTTRWHKVQACGGINLRDPVRSMRSHHRTRVQVIALACVVMVIVGATVLMVWRAWG